MKCTRIYTILGAALLVGIGLFVRRGWTVEHDVISFLFRRGEDFHLMFMNTQGEIRQSVITDLERSTSFTWSADGRSFAYCSNQDENFDIYVMDMIKKTRRRLTFHESKDLMPAWSPNGKWIAFVSERAGSRNIYRMDADGENLIRLTKQKSSSPAWSPDSQSIAFTSTALFVMSAKGKGLKRLADASSRGCSWSPDGKQIAFISKGAEGGMDIFSIGVDGRNLRQLTWSDKRAFIHEPVWSPSGKWIAYVWSKFMLPLKQVPVAEVFAAPVICIVDTEGGGGPIEATRDLRFVGSVNWAPKGFLSVALGSEKQMTFWGKLKQFEK